jgi:hypothetical protein
MAPASAQKKLPLVHTDSAGAHRTNASFHFECGETLTRLKFVEHVRDGEGIPLVDQWRLELTRLSVSGRRIPADEMTPVRALFHSLSWIERIQGRCAGNGEVEIFFRGMPARAWADYSEDKGPTQAPRATSYSIRISATGKVRIR